MAINLVVAVMGIVRWIRERGRLRVNLAASMAGSVDVQKQCSKTVRTCCMINKPGRIALKHNGRE